MFKPSIVFFEAFRGWNQSYKNNLMKMASVAGSKRKIQNKSCKIKYDALKELEKGTAPKDVAAKFEIFTFLLYRSTNKKGIPLKLVNLYNSNVSIFRTISFSPWLFEL